MNDAYLDLLGKALTGWIYPAESSRVELRPGVGTGRFPRARSAVMAPLNSRGVHVFRDAKFDPQARQRGRDWPTVAYTMVGLDRLANIRECLETVSRDRVPGDWVEAGCWRGGASIFAKAVMDSDGLSDRSLWLADSFEGMPVPTIDHDQWWSPDMSQDPYLAVTVEQVRSAFGQFGLLDGRVKFLKGWFKDTLATAPIDRISVLRLDGDLYESTMDALEPLYPKVAPGGFVIVDDYGSWPACRRAVSDYRSRHEITAPIVDVDGHGAYWRVA